VNAVLARSIDLSPLDPDNRVASETWILKLAALLAQKEEQRLTERCRLGKASSKS